MPLPIHIAIVDDHLLFSQTLSLLLNGESDFRIAFTALSGREFLGKLKTADPLPAIALIDIEMPEMNGMELNRNIQKNYPQIKVIMLSMHLEEPLITRVIEDGAASYLVKNCDSDTLTQTIRAVHREGFFINQLTRQALLRSAKEKTKLAKNPNQLPGGLTKRELDILLLICQEYNTPEISEKLFVSPRTVEGHRQRLLLKTGCRNQAGLVIFAIKHHLFEYPL